MKHILLSGGIAIFVILFISMHWLHPNIEIYKEYVKYKCCVNDNCLMKGNCKSDLSYLANRCQNSYIENLPFVKFSSISKNCYEQDMYD